MTRQSILALLAMGALTVAAGVPQIDAESVRLTQEWTHQTVISYRLLEAPGIVTLDVLTNGVSIGLANLTNAVGDVGVVVQPGDREIRWKPWETWPGQKLLGVDMQAVVTVWPTNAPPEILAIDLTKPGFPVTYYVDQTALPWGEIWTNPVYKGDVLLMRRIHASHKTFLEGSPSDEEERYPDPCELRRFVTLTNDFYMAIYPTTVRHLSRLWGDAEPSESFAPKMGVSYDQLRGSVNLDSIDWPTTGRDRVGGWLAEWRVKTGLPLDLPTSAQWEFACRAGWDDVRFYPIQDQYDRTAWTLLERPEMFVEPGMGLEVGTRSSNEWGLYALLGGGFEWCLDWEEETTRTADSVTDPLGPVESIQAGGPYRVYRGGVKGLGSSTYLTCRCAARSAGTPSVMHAHAKFRLCVTLP